MLPLRSVGRSNFVRVCVKFNNVDSKTTYFNENCCIIYIYIYIVVTMKQFSENKVLNIVNVEP